MKKILLASLLMLGTAQAFAALPAPVEKLREALAGADGCDPDLAGEEQSYSLGEGGTLYVVPCMMGAYQGSGHAFILDKAGTTAQVVNVLSRSSSTGVITAGADLMEAGYNEKTKTLSTYGKGRGVGDCGQSSESKIIVSEYGSVNVITTEIRSKLKCDGKMTDWPVVFSQKVK